MYKYLITAIIAALIGGWLAHDYSEKERIAEITSLNINGIIKERDDLKKFLAAAVEDNAAVEKERRNLEEKYEDARKQAKELSDRLSNSNTRVFLNYGGCTNGMSQSSDSIAGVGESRAYIDKGSFARIYDIGQRGDRWGEQLNYCITQYNYIRDKYGAK